MVDPGPWIPGMDAARCGGCGGVFSIRAGQCPKGCSGTEGWAPVNSTRARAEITRLRNLINTIRGALIQIARGKHSTEFKVRVASTAIDVIDEATKTETPAGETGAVRVESVQ